MTSPVTIQPRYEVRDMVEFKGSDGSLMTASIDTIRVSVRWQLKGIPPEIYIDYFFISFFGGYFKKESEILRVVKKEKSNGMS